MEDKLSIQEFCTILVRQILCDASKEETPISTTIGGKEFYLLSKEDFANFKELTKRVMTRNGFTNFAKEIWDRYFK